MIDLKNFIKFGTLLFLFSTQVVLASIIDDSNKIEEVGFAFKDLKICHQSEWRHLTVEISYESEQNLEIDVAKNFVYKFLENYSNEADFWEIMNLNLVHAYLKKFPDVHKLKTTLSLKPDRTLSFPRRSIIAYDVNDEYLKESFGFTKLNYAICSETFLSLDLSVDFDLKSNPGP